ncbi:toxin secretion/lysis holin [Bacillus phage vB_BpsM-61]|nr:toxin secretion/lysis holin [Bacillus phage vB_BpsM-61]
MKAQSTDTLFTAITGGIIASSTYLIGGLDNLTTALGIFMITDYITGLMASMHQKEKVSYDRAVKGLTKKGGMISLVIVANQLDIITGNSTGFLRDALIMIIIGSEGISIVDNAKKSGNTAPDFLVDILNKFKGTKPDK